MDTPVLFLTIWKYIKNKIYVYMSLTLLSPYTPPGRHYTLLYYLFSRVPSHQKNRGIKIRHYFFINYRNHLSSINYVIKRFKFISTIWTLGLLFNTNNNNILTHSNIHLKQNLCLHESSTLASTNWSRHTPHSSDIRNTTKQKTILDSLGPSQ